MKRSSRTVRTYKVLTPAIERVVHAAMSWQEYNDRCGVGGTWVRGSPISKLLSACRRLRKADSSGASK